MPIFLIKVILNFFKNILLTFLYKLGSLNDFFKKNNKNMAKPISMKSTELRALATIKLNSYITILASPKHKNKCCSSGAIGKIF